MSYSNEQKTVPEAQTPRSFARPSADPGGVMSTEELSLINEVLRAVRTIRYGSVVLTLHDGKVAEIQKTERLRRTD